MPAAAEQLPACFFFFIIITVGTSRSRGSPFVFFALAVPSSSSSSLLSFAYRVADIIHLVISDIVILAIFANASFRIPSAYANSPLLRGCFPEGRLLPLSFSLSSFLFLSLSLSLCFFILRRNRDTDRKPSPRHFCDYPRRSSRRASYNTHPLSRFRWRFTNSAYYPEPTRSTFF